MKNRKIILLFIIIILMQLMFKIYIDSQKEDFFIDELYSYGLMNYKQAFIFEEETFLKNWHNKEYFDEYLIVSNEEKMDWSPVYNNQTEDFHPPFYYLLLRLASSFTIGTFTKWSGLILNLVIFVVCDIIVLKIGQKIFKNKWYALLLVFVYGFSKFSAENTLFIRMYQLLELQILLLTNWSLNNCYKKELNIKDLLQLLIIIILGTLTQYYFVIFMLALVVLTIMRYARRKQYKNIAKYIGTIVLAEIIIYLIFPSYTTQLVGNAERTPESLNIINKIVRVINREQKYGDILTNNMFFINANYIIIAMGVLGTFITIIELINNYKKKVNLRINKRLNTILVPTLFYWIVVTITSPYINLRYILPIFIYIIVLMMYILKKELQILLKNRKKVLVLSSIVWIVYSTMFIGYGHIEYQYKNNKEMIEEICKYKDIPCIYMYSGGDVLNNGFVTDLNYVRQFENVYIMDKVLFLPKNVKEILKDVDTSNGIMIIEEAAKIDKKAKMIIDEIEEFNSYEKIAEEKFQEVVIKMALIKK